MQFGSLSWSDEVGVGRLGCCTSPLYLYGLAFEDGVERDVSQRAVPGTARRRRWIVVSLGLWRHMLRLRERFIDRLRTCPDLHRGAYCALLGHVLGTTHRFRRFTGTLVPWGGADFVTGGRWG